MTRIVAASLRSNVVKRLLQEAHWRRRRIEPPSSAGRESTTFDSVRPHHGQRIEPQDIGWRAVTTQHVGFGRRNEGCDNPVMPSELELVGRLALAAALGGAIGLEREISDQPAGFRTHILVALGACLFGIVSAYSFEAFLGTDEPPQVRFDPSRLAAQIVTGIGFLGAGAIIRYGMSVRGLTTAASLWVVAAIGTAAALGEYLIGTVTAAITLLALYGLKPIRSRLVRGLKKEHEEFVLEAGFSLDIDRLVHEVTEANLRIDHLRVEEDEQEGIRQIVLFLMIPPDRRPEDAVALLTRVEGIRNVDWTR
jgi:putative Mg2+ transporter-C (MgtC) family protein